MLPAIDAGGNLNFREVPYRLPSRYKTYGGGRDPMQTCSTKSPRDHNSLSRACTTLDDYMKENHSMKSEVSQITRIIPLIPSYPEVLDYRGSRLHYKARCRHMSSIQTDQHENEMENSISGSKKLLWIDDLKQWILKEPCLIDYLKLSKKATIYDNEVLHSIISKIKRQDEIKLCGMFSNQFSLQEKKGKRYYWDKYPVKAETSESNSDGRSPTTGRISVDRCSKGVDEFVLKNNEIQNEMSNIFSDTSEDETEKNVIFVMDETVTSDNRNDVLQENITISDFIERNNLAYKSVNINLNSSLFNLNNIMRDNELNEVSLLNQDDTIPRTHSLEKCVDGAHNETDTDSSHLLLLEPLNQMTIEIPEVASPLEGVQDKERFTHKVMFNFTQNIELQKTIENDGEKIHGDKIKEDETKSPNLVLDSESVFDDTIFLQLPDLPQLFDLPDPQEDSLNHSNGQISNEIERDIMAPLLPKAKPRWGVKKLDSSYSDKLEKEKLAEQRKLEMRIKLQMAVEKNKRKRKHEIQSGPRFESYGFLAKYCILTQIDVGLYRYTFDVFDEDKKQWLSSIELMRALKGVNPNLKDYEVDHINMVMKMCGYDTKFGADFKLFSVLAALSDKITTLDSWIKTYIGISEIRLMEKKLDYCRELWECLVDSESYTISMKSLCVELKAGGVTTTHIEEVNRKLGRMVELNLIDFLTYIPLFITIHMSIVDNPFDMSERM